MSWWLIEASGDGPTLEAAAVALVEATGQAVEERDRMVVGFGADQAAAEQARTALEARFGAALTVAIRPVPTTDWSTAWREGLSVRTVGRLRTGPSWLLEPAPDAVVLDPETAFGSGEHGSTRGALRLIDRHLTPGATVLDLGSGSGILSIGAVKLGAARALGIEVDEEAVPIAEDNAVRNGVADRVAFLVGDARHLAPLAGPVDLVVSNILRHVNETLLGPIAAALRPGGIAVFAGMEVGEADMFRPALAAAGFQVLTEETDEGWWSVAARCTG